MAIDRFNFPLIAGALAAGGVGGWAYRDRMPAAPLAGIASGTPVLSTSPSAVRPLAMRAVNSPRISPAVCDDSQGTPEECPTIGPEGVCANIVLKRCQEFKAAFEPRVAAQAVACLRALKPSDRCDFGRVNQCGHLALMAACPDPTLASDAQPEKARGHELPTSLALDARTSARSVADACETIQRNCGGQTLSPTLADCRQTVAGLNNVGRASMVDCVTAHCTDRGLYGCEAVPKTIGMASVHGIR